MRAEYTPEPCGISWTGRGKFELYYDLRAVSRTGLKEKGGFAFGITRFHPEITGTFPETSRCTH